MSDQNPTGYRAVMGALIAMIGVLAAAHPESAVLEALNTAVPRLADAVPAVITACGAILAALSDPPRFWRRK